MEYLWLSHCPGRASSSLGKCAWMGGDPMSSNRRSGTCLVAACTRAGRTWGEEGPGFGIPPLLPHSPPLPPVHICQGAQLGLPWSARRPSPQCCSSTCSPPLAPHPVSPSWDQAPRAAALPHQSSRPQSRSQHGAQIMDRVKDGQISNVRTCGQTSLEWDGITSLLAEGAWGWYTVRGPRMGRVYHLQLAERDWGPDHRRCLLI